jgi:hypothetical protein
LLWRPGGGVAADPGGSVMETAPYDGSVMEVDGDPGGNVARSDLTPGVLVMGVVGNPGGGVVGEV